jgi:predicted anti-sigma-YlaC factor YlaD
MECEEVSQRLWEYLDKELNAEECESVAEHLQGCLPCRRTCRCGRAFLELLARQRHACVAPASFVFRMRRLIGA